MLRAGDVLRLGVPTAGLRSYLSRARRHRRARRPRVRRSTDVLSGLGPAPLRAGDVLAVGPAPAAFPYVDVAPLRPLTNDADRGPGRVRVRGPTGSRSPTCWRRPPGRCPAAATGSASGWRAPALRHHPDRRGQELPSEGVVRGRVQVPPGGEPVLFLADHPVTGGYPVAAVVREADVDRLAQAVPGQSVRICLPGLLPVTKEEGT